jgi:hypothetical protein
MVNRAGALAISVFFLTSCTPLHGTLRDDGYVFKAYGYSVCYAKKKEKSFIHGGWQLDNFYFRKIADRWEPKSGRRYMGYRLVDLDNDGVLEKEKAFIFDLKLDHGKTQGVIWIQTFDLPKQYAKKELNVLLQSYVTSLTGTGLYAGGDIYSVVRVKQKKYAAVIKQRGSATLGDRAAVKAVIQILDLDQIKVDPQHAGSKLKVLLTKFRPWGSRPHEWALMLVGYYNTADQFDRCLADFDRFLKMIRFTTKPCK